MSNSSPRAVTFSEVTHPEALPSSSSLPSEGRERRVGPWDAPCVASRRASFPPARPGPARGLEVLLDARPVLVATSVSSAPLGAGGARSRLLRQTPAACSACCLLPALPRPQSALPSRHCTPCKVMSWENLRRPAPFCDPPGLPEFRLEKHGRIVGPAHGQMLLVIDLATGVLAASRSQSSGRGFDGRCSSRSLSSRERSHRD